MRDPSPPPQGRIISEHLKNVHELEDVQEDVKIRHSIKSFTLYCVWQLYTARR